MILALLLTLPTVSIAATPTVILANGKILSTFGNNMQSRGYDVVYKGNIYRCYTYRDGAHQRVRCYQLEDG